MAGFKPRNGAKTDREIGAILRSENEPRYYDIAKIVATIRASRRVKSGTLRRPDFTGADTVTFPLGGGQSTIFNITVH